jgi:hypothetical protein
MTRMCAGAVLVLSLLIAGPVAAQSGTSRPPKGVAPRASVRRTDTPVVLRPPKAQAAVQPARTDQRAVPNRPAVVRPAKASPAVKPE